MAAFPPVQQLDLPRTMLAAEQLRSLRGSRETEAQKRALRLQMLAGGETDAAPSLAKYGGPTVEAADDLETRREQAPEVSSRALRQYLALDPKGGKQLVDALSSLNKDQRARADRQNEMMTRLLLSVEMAPPPMKQLAWAQARAEAKRMGLPVDNVPARYSPQVSNMLAMKGMAIKDILNAPVEKVMTPKGIQYQPRFRSVGKTPYQAPLSPEGKLEADINAGAVSPEMAEIGKQRLLKPLVDMGGGNKIEESLLEMDLKSVGDMQKAVQASDDLVPRMRTIATILSSGNVETGRFNEATLPIRQWAQSLGWVSDPNLPQEEQVAAAMAYIVPRMRVAGSGQTSDREMAMFKQAAPNLSNTTAGNLIMARSFLQIQDRNKRAIDLARQYLRDHKSLDGFDRHAEAELGPVFPEPKSQAEYDAIPKDTVYLDTDGRFKVKR